MRARPDRCSSKQLRPRTTHTATASLLLDRGADVAASDSDGMTALIWAAHDGHTATAALLLDRGADAGATSNGGYTALTMAARKGHTAMAAVLAFFGAEASPKLGRKHPLLDELHGWCRLRIAATFRLHALLRRALRSGAVDRDPPAAAAAAAGVLAASSGAVPRLPGWAGLPVCATTVRLVRDAAAGWSPARHWLHHHGLRAGVYTLLLVHERTRRPASPAPVDAPLPYLPIELWLLVGRQLRRQDFARGPLPDSMRPRPWL